MNLFEESDSSADEQPVAANKLQLNQDFAAKYDAKKRGEELSKREGCSSHEMIVRADGVLVDQTQFHWRYSQG